MNKDDASWILSNTFLILTMQTGFGMLETGSVSHKNVANIMIKNCVDVTLGGLAFWIAGYAFAFGDPSRLFDGHTGFFFTPPGDAHTGTHYTHYIFQFSFASTATTIVSGAVAERMKLKGYMLFSIFNTIIYSFSAGWAWCATGFLARLGFFDFAGGIVVHTCGGASALAATIVLGPRSDRFRKDRTPDGLNSPTTALTGIFMLWWAFLGMNCGSTYGITDHRWIVAAKVSVITLNGSMGGGITGLVLSLIFKQGRIDITYVMVSIMSGIVSITAGCPILSPREAIVVGAIGASIALVAMHLLKRMQIDDPVGAIPVHLFGSLWSATAVGLFGDDEFGYLGNIHGLMHKGGWHQLVVQWIGFTSIALWNALFTVVAFLILKKFRLLRMSANEERLGADWVEHNVCSATFGVKLDKALKDINLDCDEVDLMIEKLVADLRMAVADSKIHQYKAKENSLLVEHDKEARDVF
uniref:Ammonium transporter AmtB-like domain-containing protein n=1 Tax=Plectus sambesii TaxID=2011161 RepID=A0A914WDK1_9BILA